MDCQGKAANERGGPKELPDPPMTPSPPRRRLAAALLALALLPAPAAADDLVLPGLPRGAAPDRCRPIGPHAADGPDIRLAESFRDDFDGFDPYRGPWKPHFDHGPYGDWQARTLVNNDELQIYVDPAYPGIGGQPLGLDPFAIGEGVLGLVARPTPRAALPRLRSFAYTSGMISSRASLLQKYGYFEIRARLPGGAGLWPAFWLLTPGAWPPEIDAMEARGAPGYAVHVHWSEGGARRSSGCDIPLADGTAAFHDFGVLWTSEAVAFYLDRAPVAWIRAKPGFDRPMYMLANLAVGGWAGAPDATTPFPATFAIDRITAWTLAGAAG
jgi:beta-glucanase (GH16 family)